MFVALLTPLAVLSATDDGVIRLRPSSPAGEDSGEAPDSGETTAEARRGFDYEAFEARLESLWFQRKTLLTDGRFTDAAEQSELIRDFCAEEGVHRLENMAGALVAEADRFLEEGRHKEALDSLALAESLDPGRPQIRLARATVLWKSDRSFLRSGTELLAALRAAFVRGMQDLTLFNQLALVLVIALAVCVVLFSVLMLIRYQVPFRHEVEERVVQVVDDRWAMPAGWAALFLPMMLWFVTGWAAFYWILITFRFMRRSERAAAVTLLAASMLAMPAYRMSVNVYAMSADPAVRTTLASAGGQYDPDRVLKLRQLVRAYPGDPVYRFLLAGLYKSGRYFEEAFAEYKEALELDPSLEEAHINIGNIFYTTGQYNEAVASYRRALEINSRSILAYFNQHLTQSESFRFKEAEASLQRARELDPRRLAEMLTLAGSQSDRPTVLDAKIEMASVWEAALESRAQDDGRRSSVGAWLVRQSLNPISLVSLLALVGCLVSGLVSAPDTVARRCIRCGRPFCHYCKSGREGKEYCSQCLHLFVLGDGLARETKNRKMYEVERFEKWSRRIRRLVSILLPGAAQVLRGRAGPGTLLLLLWTAGWIAWKPVLLVPAQHYAGLALRPDLLGPGAVPALFSLDPFAASGLASLAVVWLVGNAWHWRGREA